MNNKLKQNLWTSIHFKIFISLLTLGFITTMVLSSSYQIKTTEAENTVEVINFDFPLNNTFFIKHTSNSSGIYVTNHDGTVYQKGIMELKAEEGNDTAKAEYESIGYQAGEDTVLDSGVIFFNSSTPPDGKLSFLNNTMAIYKDMIQKGQNITTIAWAWK